MNIRLQGNELPAKTKIGYDFVQQVVTQHRWNGPLLLHTHPDVERLVSRLDDLQIQFLPARLGTNNISNRMAGTIIVPSKRPVIWIDLDKHSNDEDIVDTLCHESVHATALLTERWLSLPDQDVRPVEYQAEELIARVGANKIARLIKYNVERNFGRNRSEAKKIDKQLRRSMWSKENIQKLRHDGEEAAIILADFERHFVIDTRLKKQIQRLGYT